MAKGPIKRVNHFTQTIATVFSRARDLFTPDWDAKVGAEQAMSRVADRVKQGQKMTPKGAGTLKPKG